MTMELIAISEALNYIECQYNNNRKVVILVDSKSALEHLARCASGHSRGTPIAYTVLKSLHRVTDTLGLTLRLQWIPSHLGLRGNEEADRLAKLAYNDGTQFSILPFYSEILSKFKTICYRKFKEYFDEKSKEKGICNKFAYMMKKVNSPNCDLCDRVDDVHHILVECAKFTTERDLIMQKFNLNKHDTQPFLNILAEPTSEAARLLVEMILHN
ncbi:hypothetical protein ABMA28_007732 [Loxostege sticticalis]|uniref:RNase H type-1 domain-containing protein n=1 Tax=Loxostege sticticalis TaxID=481309 RepID=A0ABD0SJD5_LOXSC